MHLFSEHVYSDDENSMPTKILKAAKLKPGTFPPLTIPKRDERDIGGYYGWQNIKNLARPLHIRLLLP